MKRINKIILISLGVLFVTYLGFYHYTDQYELGLTFNLSTGEIKTDSHTGHHLSAPWVLATKLDLRPIKVCITSASRNINCRLVQFDVLKWKELIQLEGFHYYWWYNRISFNMDQETYRGFENLMLGHAYGETTRCSCVKIIQEIGESNE